MEITDIDIDIQTDPVTHPEFVPPTNTNAELLTSNFRQGQIGYFHLQVEVSTESDAGAVVGHNLWKMSVFLSPEADGSVETIAPKSIVQISTNMPLGAGHVNPLEPAEIDWEDKGRDNHLCIILSFFHGQKGLFMLKDKSMGDVM